MPAEKPEAVNHPAHYQAGGLEAIDVIEPVTVCRRCSECTGADHHWMDNSECMGPEDPMYCCKHCDAFGDECETCDGEGGKTSRPPGSTGRCSRT